MRYTRFQALSRTLPFLLTVPALVAPGIAYSQGFKAPTAAEAQAAARPASLGTHKYTRPQLDQMLAPVALYPDQLLTQVLMAATFPQQIIEAASWLQDPNNAALKGDQLVTALQPMPWDPSVKSLVAFPQILSMLNEHLDWTEALGIAFSNQQVEVMARVQALRDRALNAGKLKSTKQVSVQHRNGQVIIEPAEPNRVYVPIYNPAEVYGAWPYRDAPPVYIPPPPEFASRPVEAGFRYSEPRPVIAPLWGWGHPDWQRHEVIVDPQRYERITETTVTERRQIAVQDNVWRRVAPVIPVAIPERQRAATVQTPPGTAAPIVVVLPPAARAATNSPAATPAGVAQGHETAPAATPTQTAQPATPLAPTHQAGKPNTPVSANQAAQPSTATPNKEAAKPAATSTPAAGNQASPPSPAQSKQAATPVKPPTPSAGNQGSQPAPATPVNQVAKPSPTAPANSQAAQPSTEPGHHREAAQPAAASPVHEPAHPTASANPRPGQPPHAGVGSTSPNEPPHHGATEAARPAEAAKPVQAPHPGEAPTRPAAPHPTEAAHTPHPAELPQRPPAPHPTEAAHTPSSPSSPAEAPHPAAAPPQVTHPAPAAPAQAAHLPARAEPQHPGAPKKPQEKKPGEEEHH